MTPLENLLANFYDLTTEYVCVVSHYDGVFLLEHANKTFMDNLLFAPNSNLQNFVHTEDFAYLLTMFNRSHKEVARITCRFRTCPSAYQELDIIIKETSPNLYLLTGRELLDVCDFCENGPIPLHKVAADGTILWANKSELSYFGFSREEFLGHNISEFMVDADNVLPKLWDELRTKGTIREAHVQYVTKDGMHRNIIVDSNLHYKDGDIANTRCFIRDNTTLLSSNWKLYNQEEKFNVLMRNISAVVIELNERGFVQSFNVAAEKKYPLRASECFFHFLEGLHRDNVAKHFSTALNEEFVQFEFQDEFHRFYSACFVPMATRELSATGDAVVNKCIFLVAHDITDSKIAQELVENNLRQKTQFLCKVSHEIRTPMNGIVGIAQILLDMKLPPEVFENIQIIFNSACTLHSLLNNVLDFNKIESGLRSLICKPVELQTIFTNAINVFQAGARIKGIELKCQVSDYLTLHRLETDGLCLSQIITNLVNNSIKFTEKGSVTVTASEKIISAKEIELFISVEDTGIGISEENCSKVFHEFVQVENSAKYGGTGLGLAICKQLVEMMGGTITLKSKLGVGTKFTVTLRTKILEHNDKMPKPKKAPSSRVLNPPKYYKVLVAEDNIVNQRVAVNLLKKLNFLADVAVNGKEAIEYAKNNKYDIVFMDCHMPICDGYEATRKIREFDKKIPILALTADVVGDSRQNCFAAGMDDFLSKPITVDKMKSVISHFYVL